MVKVKNPHIFNTSDVNNSYGWEMLQKHSVNSFE